MKQNKIIAAYKILETLNNTSFDGVTAFHIYKLKKQFKEIYDFQAEREKELFEKYNAYFNEDGSISLDNMSRAEDFVKEITDMSEIEHEVKRITISANCFESITMEQIEALEDCIDFAE